MAEERILVVEDEHIVALDIKMHLERYGYEVPAMYASGEEALVNVEQLQPVLVLMDIKLSGRLDGVETAEEIKRRHNIPVILLTAYADETTIHRAKVTQPFGYIIKPFEERELRTAIVMALYRHRMEEELRRREELFSTTLNSLGEGVVVIGNDNTVGFVNSEAASLIGKRPEECYGLEREAVFSFESEAEIDSDFPEAEVLVSPDGTRIPVERTVNPLEDERGTRGGSVWVFRDIRARVQQAKALRESQEQFRQAQKMEAVGRLSGGIAHDFNNLLTVIMGYSKLMRQHIGELEGSHRDTLLSEIEGIDKAAQKSVSLTRQLLAFSRRQVLKPKPTNLNEVVSDLEKMLRRLLTEQVQLYLSLRAEQAVSYVDQGQVEQVLLNLVVNARDAMPEGGTLTISTRTAHVSDQRHTVTGTIEADDYVIMQVTDTGFGMDQDTMAKMFDPIFTTKEQGRGTGLGLATVYGIMGQMGGYIDVASAPGEGTTFTLYFPLLGADEAAESEEEAWHEEVAGNERVLLVEDDEQIRGLLSRVLRSSGYTVVEAGNAGEALLISEEDRDVDLLVTDLVMPHVTGEKLAERIRQERPNVRVLFMSGYPESFPGAGRRQRGTLFLEKPFEPNEFLRAVRSVIDE